MCLRLPDELLLAIFSFELAPINGHSQNTAQLSLPLVSVCRQWNIVFSPLLYRNVIVHLKRRRRNVQSILAALTAAEARGHSLWADIRELNIHETPVSLRSVTTHTIAGKDLNALRTLLLYSSRLDIVRTYHMSASVAHEFAHAHAGGTSFVHLDIRRPGPYSLGPIGKLHYLRRLYITTQDYGLNVFPSHVDAWSLPNLEELRWEDLRAAESFARELVPDSMAFLAACRFPRMRETVLRVRGVDTRNGPELLRVFLQANESIEILNIVLLEATCAVALNTPGTRLRQLSLQECRDVWPSLVGQIPPTMQRLDLPVYLIPGRNYWHGLGVTSTVLDALLDSPCNIREIHLAVGYQRYERKGTFGAFRFAEPPEDATPAEMIQHDMIRHSAVNLGARGVKVYDEYGMTVLE